MTVASVPLPVREAVAELLGSLLGRSVIVQRDPAPLQLGDAPQLVVANFSFESGRLAAVGLADLAFGAAAGGALAQLPPETAEQAVGAGELDGDLRDFLDEVLNVLSRLLNSSSTPRVVLRDVRHLPADALMGDSRALCQHPEARQGYVVEVEGYGQGRLALLGW